jgi:hypothetical protein
VASWGNATYVRVDTSAGREGAGGGAPVEPLAPELREPTVACRWPCPRSRPPGREVADGPRSSSRPADDGAGMRAYDQDDLRSSGNRGQIVEEAHNARGTFSHQRPAVRRGGGAASPHAARGRAARARQAYLWHVPRRERAWRTPPMAFDGFRLEFIYCGTESAVYYGIELIWISLLL